MSEQDDLDRACAELEDARQHLHHVRARVAIGADGASAVSLAEWRVHTARRRVEQLEQQLADDGEPW